MSEVNNAFEYADEVGLKELRDAVLVRTEDLLDSYITPVLDAESTAYQMPSINLVDEELRLLNELLERLRSTHQSYSDNEIDTLLQLTSIRKGELMPIPTDCIVVGTGNIDEISARDMAENPPRDEREGLRYRYYFVRETEEAPYALYIFEQGEWRVIGYTKDTLKEYWHKIDEREEIVDRILNGSYETPESVLNDVVHRSWNRIHEND